ncbi:MAG: TRAP transporter large permease subunit [Desulfobacteraceae bacterium]|jgi:tripartite ATP-independent transporter DctM subunit|nr:MAG: TRAP transporter large permease subunit [Desulfobacteraceae bacterium]
MIEMSPEIVTVLMFAGVLTGLALGHPVAFILAGLATIFALIGWGTDGWYMFLGRTFDSTTNNILIAIPNFVLMATLLGKSGIADRLFRSIMYLLGPLNGAIALAVIVWCAIEAACTGVIGASVVSMSILAIPVLLKHGYDKYLSCGSIAAGGTLSILIPPSIMLVMMADQGGVSVGKLFAGAFGPGVLLSVLFFLYIIVLTIIHPEKGPALPLEERRALSVWEKARYILLNMVPTAILIIGVLGSIWTGVATATEASGMGAFLALILMIVYGEFSWKAFAECVWSAARTNCMVMTIIVGATVFTGVFLGLGCGQVVTDIIRAFGVLGKWGMLGIMMFIVFVLGFMIDWIAIIYITFPIFLPIAKELGFDMTWFIVLLAVNLQTSFLTPPFGYALFYLQATVPPEIVLKDIYKSIIPFIIIQLIGMACCLLFPALVTYLPSVIIR